MGVKCSSRSIDNSSIMSDNTELYTEDLNCVICLRYIESEIFTGCMFCRIKLHSECYNNWLNHSKKSYCQCIHCQRIGTMTKYEKVLNYKI